MDRADSTTPREAPTPVPDWPFPVSQLALPQTAADELDGLSPAPHGMTLAIELALAGGAGAGAGAMVAVLAALLDLGHLEAPLVVIGLVSGLFAGVIAVLAGREILPRLTGFPLPARGVLVILTLAGAAFGATSLGFWIYPRYSLHQVRPVLMVGSFNGLLALVAGTLVFVYEDLARRLSRTHEILAAARVAQAQAREQAARAELQALQARINPHFFFNALNTAAAFVSEDPARAEDLLERFAGLFRYAFRRGGEAFVPLEDELRFIGDYLEIERARFGDRVSCTLEVEPAVNAIAVPPLILQPLVENAFLHGRDPETGAGRVVIRAFRAPRGVTVEVRDHGRGPGKAAEGLPRGHALENIAARLAALPGGKLEIRAAGDGPGTLARVVVPSEV